jgi:hypothetical protein
MKEEYGNLSIHRTVDKRKYPTKPVAHLPILASGTGDGPQVEIDLSETNKPQWVGWQPVRRLIKRLNKHPGARNEPLRGHNAIPATSLASRPFSLLHSKPCFGKRERQVLIEVDGETRIKSIFEHSYWSRFAFTPRPSPSRPNLSTPTICPNARS